jgi:hypothetical protein
MIDSQDIVREVQRDLQPGHAFANFTILEFNGGSTVVYSAVPGFRRNSQAAVLNIRLL